MDTENKFVYVVCGDEENIAEVEFSLKYLEKFSKYKACVVTDSSRNKRTIKFHNIIDIKTPDIYDNHQASIYLKTKLYDILDFENTCYCYLDSDVIPLNNKVDEIFKLRNGIINFASDIVNIRKFSWHAVDCKCLENNNTKRNNVEITILEYNKTHEEWKEINQKIQDKKLQLQSLITLWDKEYKLKDEALIKKKHELENHINYWNENHKIKEHLITNKQELEEHILFWDENIKDKANKINILVSEWEKKHKITKPELVQKREDLLKWLIVDKTNIIKYIKRNIILLTKYKYNKKDNIWTDNQNNVLFDEANEFNNYFKRYGLSWDDISGKWFDGEGEEYFDKKNEFSYYYNSHGFFWNSEKEIWSNNKEEILIDKKNEFEPYFQRLGFHWDSNEDIWFDSFNNIIIDEKNEFLTFFRLRGFNWDEEKQKWFDEEGIDVFDDANYYGFRNYFNRKHNYIDDANLTTIKNTNNDIADSLKHFYGYIKYKDELIWDEKESIWLDINGRDLRVPDCNHLNEAIFDKFSIKIQDYNWVHWNGGVFLFDLSSIEFMKTWHEFTMEIFKDSYWKTRDQGTLAAVAWKYDLQNITTLPKVFNFVYSARYIMDEYISPLQFKDIQSNTIYDPILLHFVYGMYDERNYVWQDVVNLL